MTEHPLDFVETEGEFKVERMDEDNYNTWHTLHTTRDYNNAMQKAEKAAEKTPETEIRIIELTAYNY